MNYKQRLKKEAQYINSLLSEYIDLHDSILSQSGTFLSMIKNLFIPIDYESIYKRTEGLVNSFEVKREDLASLESNIDNSIAQDQTKYFDQLLVFFDRLYNTVQLLKERQHKLFLKSKGHNFSREEFMMLQNKYDQSIRLYKKEGENLNKLNHIVFF